MGGVAGHRAATAALYKKVKRDPKKATDHDLTDLLMLGLYVYADPGGTTTKHEDGTRHRRHQLLRFVGRTFVFNDYKTSKFYKQQNNAIQPRLVKIIRWYHDRYGHAYLWRRPPYRRVIHRPDEGDHKAPVRETSSSASLGRSTSRSRTSSRCARCSRERRTWATTSGRVWSISGLIMVQCISMVATTSIF